MSNTRVRDKQICIFATERERNSLKRKAAKEGLTVSEYVRQTLIYSDKATVVLVDTSPFEAALAELHMQGVNLNQIAKQLNSGYGDSNLKETVRQIHEKLGDVYLNVTGALIALREEADKHKLVIDFERHIKFDDED